MKTMEILKLKVYFKKIQIKLNFRSNNIANIEIHITVILFIILSFKFA